MEDFINDHNATSKRPMKLAMFLYAAEHISRACRILKQPGAHLLNIGVGGSGRASLSRLAAFINGMTVCQVRAACDACGLSRC
jgi:dynein heavy chain, axonemal